MFLDKKKSIIIIKILIIFLSSLVFFFTNWIVSFFGDYVGYQEIIFYITSGFDSFKGAPSHILFSFFINVFLKTLVITLIIFFLFNCKINFFLISLLKKIIQNKNIIQISITCIFFLISINYFFYKFNFYELISNNFNNKIDLKINFKDPHQIKYKNPKKLKNLILIFFESAENNYPEFSLRKDIDGNLVEFLDNEDIHKSLRNLDGNEVNNFVQAKSLEWSMAGMSAAQCGVPLYNNNRSVAKNESQKYKILCISDILKRYGYKQFFFTGVKKSFQKQDDFYLHHGFDKIFGKSDFISKEIDDNYFNSWGKGLNDDILLNQAFNKIKGLNYEKKPFNIVIKTSDTHSPYKYSSPNCKNNNKFNKNFNDHFYLNLRKSFKCTSEFITEFINRLKKEDFFSNTLIVISGDHLIPTTEQSKKYLDIVDNNKDPLADRRIFFKVINSNKSPNRNLMSHYDIAPTILNDLNFLDLNEHKFGIGLSLYSDYSPQQYYDEYIKLIRSSNLSLIFKKYLKKHISLK